LFALAQDTSATEIGFIDSIAIAVCHNKRIHSHKVLKGLAKRGKSSKLAEANNPLLCDSIA